MKQNVIKEKSYAFAIDIVRIYQQLKRKSEYVLSAQLVRSGTSIGANVAEANQAQSKPDFISKMSIALKESTETEYWLRLMNDTGYIPFDTTVELLRKNLELQKILIRIINKSKDNLTAV